MRIAIGSDHRGVDVREAMIRWLESEGHEVADCGNFSTESCDYPDIAAEVSTRVASQQVDRGLLLCGTGIGMAITANKFEEVRAAVCNDELAAEMSRRHNDANVICVSADHFREVNFASVLKTWLETEFEGGRHQRRVDKIGQIFREQCEATNS